MNERIKAGSDIHAGDGGYGIGTKENYDAFVKVRNKSLAAARIRRLAEQATTYIEPTSNSGEGWIFDKQKFAELIVRECMEQVWYTREDGINGNISEVIKDRIKQHFGVDGMSTEDKKTLIKELLGVKND